MDINLPPLAVVILGVLSAVVALSVLVALIVPASRAIGWTFMQVTRFIGAVVADAFRLIGMVLTVLVLSVPALASVLLGRWSRAEHYGRALSAEGQAIVACLYRLLVGHPLRLFNAQAIVEGLEQRVPEVIQHAPPPTELPTVPARMKSAGVPRAGQFSGYTVLGTLPGGGSGGRLYIARPDAGKLTDLQRQGFGAVGDVVIKSFGLSGPGGSTLPQIVRENRALEAAKRMGLVLEHELTNERFFYVMRYVPGDSLGLVTQRLHAESGGGLAGRSLSDALGYVCDLVGTLADYHKAGLWHKDVKPDNIIVSGGHAHLVDFGLVTPLRSSMTLTTHGTEYFRDPELVRLAMRGVKVHEVDGAKFDLYAAGAVLFAVIENSFPAHGGLSQIGKPCPEAVRWIVRRAMTDYDKRYPNALAMLADLREAHRAALEGRAEALKPAELPSVRDGDAVTPAPIAPVPELANHTPPPPVGRFQGRAPAEAEPVGVAAGVAGVAGVAGAAEWRRAPGPVPRRTAREQLQSARTRVAERQRRAHTRMGWTGRFDQKPKASAGGIAVASMVFLGLILAGSMLSSRRVPPALHVAVETTGSEAAAAEAEAAGETADLGETLGATLAERVRTEAMARQMAEDFRRGFKDFAKSFREAMPGVPAAPGVPVRPGSAASAVDSAVGAGDTVLVLQEPMPLDDAASESAAKRLDRVRAMGFTLVGSAALLKDPKAAEGAVDLEAGLRGAVGLKTLAGEEARGAVKAWLNEHSEVDAVLWLIQDPKRPGHALTWLTAGNGLDAGALAALRRAATRGR